ncbi:HCP-like protein [Aspergillus terreus]|uniref:HCP-like protein n=1 Tax=Aspergillus terreus TaxID=33178 RepID=A0A5M3YQ16_ASPTE|nr:hypothetical protein ATETN484_0002079500 [Aspergillus terreus]GFF15651.1 HCP-like protein [Aspergillus terreus]
MPLRDILHKKDTLTSPSSPPVPEIKFIRSDTVSHEFITPPTYPDDSAAAAAAVRPPSSSSSQSPSRSPRRSLNPFHRSRSPSESSHSTHGERERRLSHLLRRDRAASAASPSANIPADLPQVPAAGGRADQETEAQWEKRATVLVQRNPNWGAGGWGGGGGGLATPGGGRSRSRSSSIGDAEKDLDIQEAIRLHEVGELEKSTDMFRRLADPDGANNALSQVLYGLALRHGWGCPQDSAKAVTYLSAAAANSASIESQALQAGMKKGGAAKGELVLAIFELGNCFRNGWGVAKDAVAARQYFETAANLGDTDAMNETAWCYLEGFGGKKDKFMAAKYYRMAEEKGSKLVGNSWIWKEKYNPK